MGVIPIKKTKRQLEQEEERIKNDTKGFRFDLGNWRKSKKSFQLQ